MALNLSVNDQEELKPRITVFGVGGAGGNAVNNMIEKQLEGVEFVVANTDAQALQQSKSSARIQMGVKVTEGLGAGARPSVGAAAAEETIEEIIDHLAGSHMCFITAGMGGGTGTGAAPIIAQAARELGVLTVGVVTKPFQFEGNKRMRQADDGIDALQKVVDTLIIIPNQNLFRLANEKTTFTEAFQMADDVLYQGVKGVTDLMVRPGLINLDFADVRAVMDEMGKAMMGTGEAEGDDRAIHAAEKAIANPLLDEISLNGAKGVLINITGGYDLTLFELDEAANIIRDKVDADANIIVGSTLDTSMEGRLRVSVVATGIDAVPATAAQPVQRRPLSEPLVPPAARAQQPAAPEVRPEARVAEPRHVEARQFEPRQPETRMDRQPEIAQRAAPQTRAPEPRPEPRQEPSLFDGYAQQPRQEFRPAAYEEAADDLPPPAYRPQPAPRTNFAVQDDPGTFVAPRPRTPGTPSQETLARLHAAVSKNPTRGVPAPQREQGGQPMRQQPVAEKPRMGLGSLINRMTGHGAESTHEPPRQAAPLSRQQPPMAGYDDEPDMSPEQERIEIPAFLRRQAN